MEPTKPRMLRPGDRLAAVSLSAGLAGQVRHRFDVGKRQLEQAFDVELVPSRHCFEDPDWLWRHPEARAEDLMEVLSDPEIAGVISCIGGEESVRLLPFLDLDVIRANPKVYMGYSDTTTTLISFLRAGVVSFYGPAILSGFAENGGLHAYMEESVRRTLFSFEPVGVIPENRAGWTVEFLDWFEPANQQVARRLTPNEPWRYSGRGAGRGRLIGGCMEVWECLKGTPYWPAPELLEGAVLFLETSEEAPPPGKVERWLRNWGSMGVLQRLSGLLFGRPGGPVDPARFPEYDAAVDKVVRHELGLAHLPVVTGMDFGHTDPICVLPIGVQAEVNVDARTVSILEPAVRAE